MRKGRAVSIILSGKWAVKQQVAGLLIRTPMYQIMVKTSVE